MPKIYIASPFFNEKEIDNLSRVERLLEDRGFQVFSPRQHEVRNDETKGQSWWSKETFLNDKRFIDWAEVVVMLYYGCYSDSGTAWECGYAYGTHTPVVVVHLESAPDNGSNLMVHEGCHTNLSSIAELEDFDFDLLLPVKPYEGKMF